MINELYSHIPGLVRDELSFLKARDGLSGLKILVAGLPETKNLSVLETLITRDHYFILLTLEFTCDY